jgi:hypothetical protein
MSRKRQKEHEAHESIGEEFAEHHGPIGTRSPDCVVKSQIFQRDMRKEK